MSREKKKKAEMMYKWKIALTIVIDPYHTLPFCLLEMTFFMLSFARKNYQIKDAVLVYPPIK